MKRAKLDHPHYCVIGKNSNGVNGINRTWGTLADTIGHAEHFLNSQSAQSSDKTTLYVVKVVRVVRKSPIPTEVLTVF